MKWTRDNFVLYDERDKVDVETVHAMLTEAYWARGRSLDTVQDTVDRCLCFSLYDESSQIGFTRVLTDYATYAIILDVLIQEPYRGQGLGKWMIECITNHPDIVSLKQALWTSSADGLYRKCGFAVPEGVRFMVKTAKRSRDRT
jgi:GNAT superfamily N-acetyltransferase